MQQVIKVFKVRLVIKVLQVIKEPKEQLVYKVQQEP